MSITSLVNEEMARQRRTGVEIQEGVDGVPPVKPKTSAAFEALARYIPTEVVTLYIAAASAMAAIKTTFPTVNETNTYWFFVFLTPVVFLIVFAGQRKANNQSAIPWPHKWPWWKLFAATTAFAVWALAVPTNPYLSGPEGGAIAAFFATFISIVLSLLAPIFESNTPSPA